MRIPISAQPQAVLFPQREPPIANATCKGRAHLCQGHSGAFQDIPQHEQENGLQKDTLDNGLAEGVG